MQARPSASAAPQARFYAVGGDVDMTTVVLMVDAERLRDALRPLAPVVPMPLSEAPAGAHPVCIDFWQIQGGRAEALGIEQEDWAELAGAAAGATAAGTGGALFGAQVGGLSGMGWGGLMGAWLGPAGAWWGAAAGGLAGAATGSFMGGLSAGTLGAAFGAASGRSASQALLGPLGNYLEASILIPGVTANGRGPCTLVASMYTDSELALRLEEAIGFGFHKRLASITRAAGAGGGGDWQIRSPDGRELVAWSAAPGEPGWRPAHACPELAPLRRWLSWPALGHPGRGGLTVSRLVRLYDDPSAVVAPAGGLLRVGPGFASSVPSGDHPSVAILGRHVPVRLTYPERLS